MKYNSEIHKRRTIRLKDYDYSKDGIYFITICTYNRECILSKIEKEKVILTEYGEIVERCILKIEQIYRNVNICNYVIMPNYIHFILQINSICSSNCEIQNIENLNKWQKSKMILPKIIQQLKSNTVKISKQLNNMQYLYWQRNYYEHIIRNETEYMKIYEYIKYNPLNWKEDIYNEI